MDELLSVDIEGWLAEVPLIKEHFAKFGDHLPKGLHDEVAGLEQRLEGGEAVGFSSELSVLTISTTYRISCAILEFATNWKLANNRP